MANDIVELKYPDGYGQPDDLVGMIRLVAGTQYMGEKYLPADGRTVKKSDFPDFVASGASVRLNTYMSGVDAANRPGTSEQSFIADVRVDPTNPNRFISVCSSFEGFMFRIAESLDRGVTWRHIGFVNLGGTAYNGAATNSHLLYLNSKWYIVNPFGVLLYSTNAVSWTAETSSSKKFTQTATLYTVSNRFTYFKNCLFTGIYGNVVAGQKLDFTTGNSSIINLHTQLKLASNVGSNNASGASGYFFATDTNLYYYEPSTAQILISPDGINFTKLTTLTMANKLNYSGFPSFSIINNKIYIILEQDIYLATDDFSTLTKCINFSRGSTNKLNPGNVKLFKQPSTGFFMLVPVEPMSQSPFFVFNDTFTDQSGAFNAGGSYYFSGKGSELIPYSTTNDLSYLFVSKYDFSGHWTLKTSDISAALFGDMIIPNIAAPSANLKYYIRVKR